MIATKEKLAQVLHGAALLDMERAARAGCYDDFESESATPKLDLVRDLRAKGQPDLAMRAVGGEWDATMEEADAWLSGAVGRETMAKFKTVEESVASAARAAAREAKRTPNVPGGGPQDVTVAKHTPTNTLEEVANAILEALKAQLGEGFEFIVHVIETRDGETRYATGAAVEDPSLLPMHAWRALQTMADPETIAKLRRIMADA